jgi:hypothetical protein
MNSLPIWLPLNLKYDQETLCVRYTILGIEDFCTNPLVTPLALYQRDAHRLNTKSTVYIHEILSIQSTYTKTPTNKA